MDFSPEHFLVLQSLGVDEVPSVEHAERVGEEGDGLGHAEDRTPRRRLGPDSIEEKIGLSLGLKKGLRFHFDSETCLNYPIFEHFLSAGNLKPKLKRFFKPNMFLLN